MATNGSSQIAVDTSKLHDAAASVGSLAPRYDTVQSVLTTANRNQTDYGDMSNPAEAAIVNAILAAAEVLSADVSALQVNIQAVSHGLRGASISWTTRDHHVAGTGS